MTPETRRRLDAYGRMLREAPLNLVSAGERAHVGAVHVAEAVALAPLLPLRAGARWVDLGTGGGLPGLPLAIVRPDVEWLLVDSSAKKIRAVAGFIGELGVANARAVHGRGETLARLDEHRERYDGVISRAVADLGVVAELSRGFVGAGGHVVAVKGPQAQAELTRNAAALEALGLEAVELRAVVAAVRPTRLVTLRAGGGCPTAYPRRDGLPQRRPLGR